MSAGVAADVVPVLEDERSPGVDRWLLELADCDAHAELFRQARWELTGHLVEEELNRALSAHRARAGGSPVPLAAYLTIWLIRKYGGAILPTVVEPGLVDVRGAL